MKALLMLTAALSAVPAQALTLQEFRQMCADARALDHERGVPEVTLQCKSHETLFVPAESDPGLQLPATSSVTMSLSTAKWAVPPSEVHVPVAPRAVTCRYKEVEETLVLEKKISCAEFLQMQDVNTFCAMSIEANKRIYPKLVETHDTGRTVELCKVQ
jgi:hypothetical protein